MQAFINEKSLQGQYNAGNVEQGIKSFIGTLTILEKIKNQGTIFKSNLFFNEQAIAGIHFNSILSTNGDLLNSFLNNLKSAVKWEDSQLHDGEIMYTWNVDLVSGTSVAEIAERKLQDGTLMGLLLNFTNSTYANQNEIDVIKDPKQTIQVDCAHNESSLLVWLRKNGLIAKHDAYDEKLKVPPFDDQTVLTGPEFEITLYKNKGRRAYRLKGTNQLWAVDASEGHLFGKPHVEVFNEIDGLHMGTSIYNKIALDAAYKVNKRTINLARTYPID